MEPKIAAAFVKAQKSFAPALKTSSNPHFRSKYADLSACVEAVIDALNSNGIALMQIPHESEGGVMVETMFLHESGESMSGGKFFLPASKNDAQGFGSAMTYARRYGLMAACGIAPEDDDGNAAVRAKPEPVKTITDKQAQDLDALITEVNADRDAFLKFAKLERLEDMKASDYEKAVKALNKKREVAA